MPLKLHILDDKRFTCQCCGECCRYLHVQLLETDIQRIDKLNWPSEKPYGDMAYYMDHEGRQFLRHRDNGYCVFFNEANNHCHLHEQFGEVTKPIGCRLYPFRLYRTLGETVTVMPRHECPSVRKNVGSRYQASELMKLSADLLDDQKPLSMQQRCELDEDQIQAIVDFLVALLPTQHTPVHKAVFLYGLCDWLAHQPVSELTRESLAHLYQPLSDHVQQWVSEKQNRRLPAIGRYAFANLLAMYLRRDEDVLDRRVGRMKRALKILLFGLGLASVNDLGTVYQAGGNNSHVMYAKPLHAISDLNRMDELVKTRLKTLGFMGKANHNMDLLDGLRSLCMLYPLLIGTAKLFANADESMDMAVGAIDHAFGISPALRLSAAHRLVGQLLAPDTFIAMMVDLCR